MGYEIIVLDLDGTLTNDEKIITPKTKEALMEMQRRGKRVVLASGRPTQGVSHLANELELNRYEGYVLSSVRPLPLPRRRRGCFRGPT